MTYAITKKFVSGILEGMEYKELTGVQFVEGRQYGNYIITSCKPIDNNTTVQMDVMKQYLAVLETRAKIENVDLGE